MIRRPPRSTLFPTRRSSDLAEHGDPRLELANVGHLEIDGHGLPLVSADARVPHELARARPRRSEEHTSELQSLTNLVCRLLLEKKKKNNRKRNVQITLGIDT